MSILHVINVTGQDILFENIDMTNKESLSQFIPKTATITFPFLETNSGNISQTNSIVYYLATKYKKDLFGLNTFENAKINQWIEFANCEINNCLKEIIYPIFGWKEFNKDLSNKENGKLNDYIKILESELTNKDYIVGNRLTLADIVLFRYLRFFMIFQFPEGKRNKLMPNVTRWFENIMNTKEAIKAYGTTTLCKIPVKPFTDKIFTHKEKTKDDNKHTKKGKNENKKDKED